MSKKVFAACLLLDIVALDIAQAAPPFDGIPPSPVQQKSIGQWSFTKSNAFSPGTNWSPLDERQVFHTRLQQTQGLADSFEIRIGKGSQIYSLIGPYGETIAPQGLASTGSEWVDEVLQTVAIDRNQNNPPSASYFIHQAGAYERDPIMTETFYSPLLDEFWDNANNVYTTLVWPQQAHVPTSFTTNLLLEQQIRAIGDGVVEVTYLYHNFGQDQMGFVSLPWVVVRNSNLPVQLLSEPGGTYKRQQETWPNGLLDIANTGGWFAFANGDTSDSLGYGIVFGKDKYFGSSFQWDHHKLRWGTINNVARDGAVDTVQARVNINPGENFFWRYYIVINTVDKIQQYSNELADLVEYGPVNFSASSSARISLCTQTTSTGQLTLTDSCGGGQTVIFQTYQDRVGTSQPLFVLEDTTTSDRVITNDPYKLSSKPYDGKTRYIGFLGWALPSNPILDVIQDAPVLSDLQPAGQLPGGTTQTALRVISDEIATCRYSPTAGTDYHSMTAFSSSSSTSHSTTITGISDGMAYRYYVRCMDLAGNANTSDREIRFSVGTGGAGDPEDPMVSLTAPSSGRTVTGTVTISANATDNVGVTQVEFLVDGSVIGTDGSSPYSFAWDTTNGGTHGCIGSHTHELVARAYDAAGNQGQVRP